MDLKNKLSKYVFLYKYLFIYNIYANIFLFIFTMLIIALIKLINVNSINLFNVFEMIILFIGILICMYMFLNISVRINVKWKYYRITLIRIIKHGFDKEYFKYGFYEPCMRLISYDILKMTGHKHLYKDLKILYSNKNMYIENQKSKLIDHLKKDKGAISVEFEEIGRNNHG